MAKETVNVVVPVIRSKKGRLELGVPSTFKTPQEAKRRAESTAQRAEGAVAISRTGDTEFGEYEDPILIGCFGNVPASVLERIVPMPF